MRRLRPICGAVLASLALTVASQGAHADFKVWQPDAEYGETAIETLGDWGHDPHAARSGEESFTEEIEHGVTSFWLTELELEQNRLPGPDVPTNFSQVTSENLFQFTPRGEYWLDAGFYFEYGQTMLPRTPNEITFGPVLRKEFFHTIDTVNIFFQKDLGNYASAGPSFLYAWETRIDLGTAIEPGFQAYGEAGAFGHFAPLGQQDHRLGPMLFGTIAALGPGSLKWNGGILFGLTPAAPRETVRWQLEYELHF
jgi:hypothetical protein